MRILDYEFLFFIFPIFLILMGLCSFSGDLQVKNFEAFNQNNCKFKNLIKKNLAFHNLLFLYKEQTYLPGSITAGYFEISFICFGNPNSEEGISI